MINPGDKEIVQPVNTEISGTIGEESRKLELQIIFALNLIHGLCEAKSALEKAIDGFPTDAQKDPVYARLKAYKDDINQVLIDLKPTVTFKNSAPGGSKT